LIEYDNLEKNLLYMLYVVIYRVMFRKKKWYTCISRTN